MRFIGNVLRFLFGGFVTGIPIGRQLFKIARLSLMPFGAEVV